MSAAHDRSIFERLERLAAYATVPEFVQAFYELIAEYLVDSGSLDGPVGRYFLEYLRVEDRYHNSLTPLEADGALDLASVRDSTEKREIGLLSVLELLIEVHATGQAELARVLLSAECYFHLGLTDRVVERLETAITCGADHPLVQFALGYNRFELANEAFTAYDMESGETQVVDEDRYRLACLNAVNAFQQGMTGEEFDGQLHWWIGNVLRAAGFGDAADASLRRAAEMIGAQYEWDGDDYLAEFDEDAELEYGPITAEEVAAVAEALRRSYLPTDLV